MVTIYESLDQERKQGQLNQEVPQWMTTDGLQMLKDKYLLPGQSPRDRYQQIAEAAGSYATKMYGDSDWTQKFFSIIWKGWLSPATPILSNLGTDRGMPVSCSGLVVEDSINGFYSSRHETAMLTKHGFGTSAYLGGIRSRGTEISVGGKASGTMPVFKGFIQDMRDVSQGSVRRGAWAGYIEVDHDDFHEIADFLFNNPDGFNLGWIIPQKFIEKMNSGDKESISRYQKIMKIRKITGKGYMFFPDKANNAAPEWLKVNAPSILATQLCTEIMLPSDAEHTYSCVLSSMNLAFYDEWKDTDAVRLAIVFLDSVLEAFMDQAEGVPGFERILRGTRKSRALGLGTMGFHTYLQNKMISIEELRAHTINIQIYKGIREQADEATRWIADLAGEPEWCSGFGVRNATVMAVAPNMSTAMICGGVSQGIEPIVANVYNQNSQAGEILRINPTLQKLMEARGVFTKSHLQEITDDHGSVRNVNWLSDEEKLVFRTAFEIDQMALIRLASSRQRFIDQGQSLNLFFDAEEDPKYVSKVHRAAMEDPNIKSLYYLRSQAGIQASKDSCLACEG